MVDAQRLRLAERRAHDAVDRLRALKVVPERLLEHDADVRAVQARASELIGDDGNRVREYEKFPGRIYAVAFDKTGRYFAAGSSLDQTGEARVYEVDTGKRVSTFEAVKTQVYAVAFRPDGKVVATGGFDGVVRLSDPMTGKLVKEFVPVPGKK